MMRKPTRKAVAAAIAAQAPPGWEPKPRAKTRRKMIDDGLENLGGRDERDPNDDT